MLSNELTLHVSTRVFILLDEVVLRMVAASHEMA